MKWDESCCVGFQAIDDKRYELFEVISSLINEKSQKKKIKILEALKLTAKYASNQFPVEEELMRDVFFPALVEHIGQHQELKRQVSNYLIALKSDENTNLEEISSFLLRWLNNHILGYDLKFGKYRTDTLREQDEHAVGLKEIEVQAKPIERLAKLKKLFQEKLISIEDFKEKKIKIFADHLRGRGLENLRDSIIDLQKYVMQGHINDKEKGLVLVEFFSNVDLDNSLKEINELEAKLILVNTFYECGLIEEEKFQSLKEKILSEI
ncbi:MAG: hypothetical protein Kow0029_17110 [Candidatus Rifleibacteriota bacterium]